MNKPRIVKNVEGLILSYHSKYGSGVVLLNRPGKSKFIEVIEEYMQDTLDKGYWFAKFEWSALDKDCKTKILSRIKHSRTRFQQRLDLNRFMMGRLIICDVARSPKWKVISIGKMDIKGKPIKFSSHRHKQFYRHKKKIKKRKKEKFVESQAAKRFYRVNLLTPSNIRRPYRG
jgi:hypothetical protein